MKIQNKISAFKMDHLLDHSTKHDDWITYDKKSADDLTHKSEKRTERKFSKTRIQSYSAIIFYDVAIKINIVLLDFKISLTENSLKYSQLAAYFPTWKSDQCTPYAWHRKISNRIPNPQKSNLIFDRRHFEYHYFDNGESFLK